MSRLLTIGWFLLAGMGVLVLEWAARRPGTRIPTLGHVLGVLMRYRTGGFPLGRVLILAGCWWAGWHFLAR